MNECVSDSDGENSLPLLAPSAIDIPLLRQVYAILSTGTRIRLQREAAYSQFRGIYDNIFDEQPEEYPQHEEPPHIEIPLTSQLQALLQADASLQEIQPPTENGTNEPPIENAPQPETEANQHAWWTDAGSRRSLRKRTFASRHPYIADQADYLGICTTDSLNEMFSGDDDLPHVVKVLNQLYVRKKKRYPDEERYKAKNFYAHLGKSKSMALQGDPDAVSSDVLNKIESQNNDDDEQYELDNDDNEDNEEELIPLEHFPQLAPPRIADLSSEESDIESIISTPSRPVVKHRRRKELHPRKGLAVKKKGPALHRHPANLDIRSFVDNQETTEEYRPNHLLTQPSITPQPSITRFYLDLSTAVEVSSLDYASDASEDLFSDQDKENFPHPEPFTPSSTHIDDGYESAQEGDHINYLLAGARKSSHKKHHGTTRKEKLLRTPRSAPRSSGGTKRKYQSTHAQPKRRRLGVSLKSSRTPMTRKPTNHSVPAGKASAPKNSRKEQKQSVFDFDEAPKPVPKPRAPEREPFRRNPFIATTAFEVESSTKFIRNKVSEYKSVNPFSFPLKSSLFGGELHQKQVSLLDLEDIGRIHSIGDGFMFFPHEDTVSFMLVGKHYTLALFQEQQAVHNVDMLLNQIRKLLRLPDYISNNLIRSEMMNAIKALIKWLLISRKPAGPSAWAILTKLLDDFSKLQTKQICQLRCIFHAYFLFLFYICYKLESALGQGSILAFEDLNKFTIDFWTNLFQSFSPTEISDSFNPDASLDEVSSSLCIIYFIFSTQHDIWWPQISEAVHDITPITNNKTDIFNTEYILASMVPKKHHNWSIFTSVLGLLPTSKSSDFHHAFVDITELVFQRLDWPLEEKLVLSLYASCAKKKFANFEDETAVPPAIGLVHTRADIPSSTIFERFLCLLYTYISELSHKKEVKRLISKLVASSQYHYQKGRRYQIMFVNRLNLILLLVQLCDVDLRNLFTNLVDQIQDSKDMFVYGRVVEALEIFLELATTRNQGLPHRAYQTLLEVFLANFDALFGVPALLKRLLGIVRRSFSLKNDTLEILQRIDLKLIPDPLKKDVLSLIYDFGSRYAEEGLNASKIVRSNLAFLDSQMCRYPDPHRNLQLETVIELSIDVWNLWAIIENTHNWNAMILQRFPYLGNKDLRDHFVLYFCLAYLRYGAVQHTTVSEMDRFLIKSLVMRNTSRYAFELLNVLRKSRGSLMASKKFPIPELQSSLQLESMRFQIISCTLHNMMLASTLAQNEKMIFTQELIITLQEEFRKFFHDNAFSDFTRRLLLLVGNVCEDVIEEVDQFWDLSDKLGFPSKRMHTAWVSASEEERLLIVHGEFLAALQYEKNYADTLDNWIRPENAHLLYSAIEIYFSAATKTEMHWAHVSFLLRYTEHKLSTFQLRLTDSMFKKLLQLLAEMARFLDLGQTSYALYQIECSTCIAKIMSNAFWCFDGYQDIDECLEFLKETQENFEKTPEDRITRVFSDIKLSQLKTPPGVGYNPPFEHTPEEYHRAKEQFYKQLEKMRSITEVPDELTEELVTLSI